MMYVISRPVYKAQSQTITFLFSLSMTTLRSFVEGVKVVRLEKHESLTHPLGKNCQQSHSMRNKLHCTLHDEQ